MCLAGSGEAVYTRVVAVLIGWRHDDLGVMVSRVESCFEMSPVVLGFTVE